MSDQAVLAQIREQLKQVIDPELRINIVDLGLIYDLGYEGGKATVVMTLTFPGCPLGFIIEEAVRQYLLALKEVKEIDLKIVWEPLWSIERIHPEVRAQYGLKVKRI